MAFVCPRKTVSSSIAAAQHEKRNARPGEGGVGNSVGCSCEGQQKRRRGVQELHETQVGQR